MRPSHETDTSSIADPEAHGFSGLCPRASGGLVLARQRDAGLHRSLQQAATLAQGAPARRRDQAEPSSNDRKGPKRKRSHRFATRGRLSENAAMEYRHRHRGARS